MDSKHEASTIEYAAALLRGAKGGFLDLMHPIDNILIPLGQPLYDAGVVLAQSQMETSPDKDVKFLRDFGGADGKREYYNSLNRLKQLKETVRTLPERVAALTPLEKAEMIGHSFTTLLVPGAAIRGVKMVVNPFPYIKPLTRIRDMPPDFPRQVAPLTLRDVRAMKSENLMYVVNWDNKLIITKAEYDHFTLGMINGIPKPARAAGDITLSGGMIEMINNRSGTYRIPYSQALAANTEKTFREFGFIEATGVFKGFIEKKLPTPDWIALTISASLTFSKLEDKMGSGPVAKYLKTKKAEHARRAKARQMQKIDSELNSFKQSLAAEIEQKIARAKQQAQADSDRCKLQQDSALALETHCRFAGARAAGATYVDNYDLKHVRQGIYDRYVADQEAKFKQIADNLIAEGQKAVEAKRREIAQRAAVSEALAAELFKSGFDKLCQEVKSGRATERDVDIFFSKY